jgi:hypothetical protein
MLTASPGGGPTIRGEITMSTTGTDRARLSRRTAIAATATAAATAAAVLGAPGAAFADGGDDGSGSAADQLAIAKLAVYYGLGTDAIAAAAGAAAGLPYYRRIFTPDATIAAGFDRSAPALTSTGPDEWAAVVAGAFVPYQATQHLLGTINVEIGRDGAGNRTKKSRASMSTYLTATHVFRANKDLLIVLGTYYDDVERTRGGWRIVNRFLQFTSFETRQRTAP